MLINLSEIFSGSRPVLEQDVFPEKEFYESSFGSFRFLSKEPMHLRIVSDGKDKARISGSFRMVFETRCDRCLKQTETVVESDFERTVVSPGSETEEEDARDCMDAYSLDTEALMQDEISVNWPVKILCREDCKGLCPVCGQNLNEGTCGCDTFVPDPRMAALKDIFESSKEV